MSEGKRPGGLTALAVINFVFFGLGCLGILAMVALIAIFSSETTSPELEEAKKAFEEAGVGMGFFVAIIVLSAVSNLLLLLSGIGYLKQKKFLGRTLGTVYAVLAIVSGLGSALMIPEGETTGGGFNIGTIIGLIYPVLTVVLINTTFRDDLVN